MNSEAGEGILSAVVIGLAGVVFSIAVVRAYKALSRLLD